MSLPFPVFPPWLRPRSPRSVSARPRSACGGRPGARPDRLSSYRPAWCRSGSIVGPVQTLAIEIPGTFNCWQGQSGYRGSSASADCDRQAAVVTTTPKVKPRIERATPRLLGDLPPLASRPAGARRKDRFADDFAGAQACRGYIGYRPRLANQIGRIGDTAVLDRRQTSQGGIQLFHPVIAGLCGCTVAALLSAAAWSGTDPPRIDPASLPRVGTVDPRFQSYNIEMVEITGGDFGGPTEQNPMLRARRRDRTRRRAWTPICFNIGRRSTSPMPGCGCSRRRWGRPIFASAAPGRTPRILPIPTGRPRCRHRASKAF